MTKFAEHLVLIAKYFPSLPADPLRPVGHDLDETERLMKMPRVWRLALIDSKDMKITGG